MMYVCMHAFIPFMHGPTKYDYSRIRDIHIQSRDASLEHHTKSHPNTLQLYISPAGGGCFPHSRRILEALDTLELAGAAGAAGAAARLEPARGDATGVGRGELSQPLFGEGTGGVTAQAAGAAGAVAGGGGAAISGGSSASWVSPSCSNTSDAATMVRWSSHLSQGPDQGVTILLGCRVSSLVGTIQFEATE